MEPPYPLLRGPIERAPDRPGYWRVVKPSWARTYGGRNRDQTRHGSRSRDRGSR